MRCIYLDKSGLCLAQPPNVDGDFKPDADFKKRYCENTLDVMACRRLRTYQNHLKAIAGK